MNALLMVTQIEALDRHLLISKLSLICLFYDAINALRREVHASSMAAGCWMAAAWLPGLEKLVLSKTEAHHGMQISEDALLLLQLCRHQRL